MIAATDRRKRRRVPLQWPVQLLRQDPGQTISTTTLNLSSDGFYCVSPEPVDAGEVLRCSITIPEDNGTSLSVWCRVRIVRVEIDPHTLTYGVGCQILQFTLEQASEDLVDCERPAC